MYFKLSIVTLNIFINLMLLKLIFFTNFTYLIKRILFYLSKCFTFTLCVTCSYNFNLAEKFQKLAHPILVFSQGLCIIFAIFCINVLKFGKRTSLLNIGTNALILKQNYRTLLPKPSSLLFAFWLLEVNITGFVVKSLRMFCRYSLEYY